MKIVCREIKTTDIEEFNKLMDDLSHRAVNNELLLKQFEKAIANPNMYLMVAEDTESGKLCGSMLGLICEDFCDDCRPLLYIENVVTGHEFRRMGIAKTMFDEMEKWGKEQDINYAVLCSGLNRLEAHKFYANIGYDEVKGFKKYL